ncbi:unnamed protein product, partial [Laminaria digitata]
MPEGKGFMVSHPLKYPAGFKARIPMEVDVKDKLSHVIQVVVRIKELPQVLTPPQPVATTSLCSHDTCSRTPKFNFESRTSATYCKDHAEDGMVKYRRNFCSHDSCARVPSFNTEGSKIPVYCKQHAEDGMVDVRSKRCSYESCGRRPGF